MPVYAEDYEITNYDINVNVNENNSFDITEVIDVDFSVPKHGIYRLIPVRGTVTRNIGDMENPSIKVDQYKARVKNVKVSDKFETSYVNSNIEIKIGDKDKLVNGNKTYKISYTYYLGKDMLEGSDEFYLNLIGTGWNTTIKNVSFKINMPKEFDSSKLGFSRGLEGSANASGIDFSVDGTSIKGSASNFSAHEALTVRSSLEDGYFVFEKNEILYLLYLFPLIILAVSYILWKKYGKDDIVVDQVEFYPPNDLNSVDIAFCYNGSVNSKDIVSLIIYLANKGYLKVTEETNGKIIKKESFTITKLKDYDGDNEQERIFFNGLFKGSKNTVTKEDLQNSFYETMNRVISSKNKKKNRDEIFESVASSKQLLTGFLMIIGIAIVILKPYINNFYVGSAGSIIFTLFATIMSLLIPYNNKKSIVLKLLSIVLGLIIFIFASVLFMGEVLSDDKLDLIGYIFGMLASACVMFFVGIMPKRTPYGIDILGKINGFKTFLETAEKEKLETLVESDPKYFYNILPFTYVLGVSNKWIKKFEDITMEPPEWYYSSNPYNYYSFTHFMDNTITSANAAMVSTPNPSGGSGGGFTGGGFSGGGFGGGGGGSW